MSTLERDTRTGMFGAYLWLVDLEQSRAPVDKRRRRRLVIEPYSPLAIGTPTRLDAWVEEERAIYFWESDVPQRKPKGSPTFRVEWRRIDESIRTACTGIPSIGFAVIRALARGELVGESAKEVMHDLFWSAFVMDTEGLNYLCKWASPPTGEFYARQRFDWQTNQLKRVDAERTLPDGTKNPVVQLLIEVTREDEPLLGLRAWERAVVDDTYYDALAALATLADDDARTESVLRFLRLHKSKRTP